MSITKKYKIMARPKAKEHYVNNKDFLDAIEIYFAEVKRAEAAGKPKPPIPR